MRPFGAYPAGSSHGGAASGGLCGQRGLVVPLQLGLGPLRHACTTLLLQLQLQLQLASGGLGERRQKLEALGDKEPDGGSARSLVGVVLVVLMVVGVVVVVVVMMWGKGVQPQPWAGALTEKPQQADQLPSFRNRTVERRTPGLGRGSMSSVGTGALVGAPSVGTASVDTPFVDTAFDATACISMFLAISDSEMPPSTDPVAFLGSCGNEHFLHIA